MAATIYCVLCREQYEPSLHDKHVPTLNEMCIHNNAQIIMIS